MENHNRTEHPDTERKRAAQSLSLKVLIVLTVLIVGYVAYALVTKSLSLFVFEILLGAFVVIYLVMTDIVEPWLMGLFREADSLRMAGFMKMMLMDVIGAGALLYWIAGMNNQSEGYDVLFPLLVYFLTAQIKRKYRREFEGIEEEEEKEEEQSEEEKESEEDTL